jgi:hypothetical protein
MAPTGVLLLLPLESGVDVADVVEGSVDVVVEVVVVEPKLCVANQPGSTVRRVPLPAVKEHPRTVYSSTDLSVEADVEMTQVKQAGSVEVPLKKKKQENVSECFNSHR